MNTNRRKWVGLGTSFVVTAFALLGVLWGGSQTLALGSSLTVSNSTPKIGEILTLTGALDFSTNEEFSVKNVTLGIAGMQDVPTFQLPLNAGTHNLTSSLPLDGSGNRVGALSCVVSLTDLTWHGYGYFGFGYGYGYRASSNNAKLNYACQYTLPPATGEHKVTFAVVTDAINADLTSVATYHVQETISAQPVQNFAPVPVATATPTPTPVAAGGAQSVGAAGGVLSFAGGAVSVDVPSGALSETVDLRVTSHTVATSPGPAPAGATLGSQIFTLEVLKDGAVDSAYKFSRLVEITVSYSAADKSAAGTPILNTLKLYVYDSPSGAWLELSSIPDVVNETMTTFQSGTGVFALVAKPILPSAGDWAPSNGMVMSAMFAGFLMMLVGSGYYVARLRVRSRN